MEKERKLVVSIPISLHRRLKIYAAERDETIRNVVINTLTATIEPTSKQTKRMSKKKS